MTYWTAGKCVCMIGRGVRRRRSTDHDYHETRRGGRLSIRPASCRYHDRREQGFRRADGSRHTDRDGIGSTMGKIDAPRYFWCCERAWLFHVSAKVAAEALPCGSHAALGVGLQEGDVPQKLFSTRQSRIKSFRSAATPTQNTMNYIYGSIGQRRGGGGRETAATRVGCIGEAGSARVRRLSVMRGLHVEAMI